MENRKIKPLTIHQKMTIQLWLGVGLVIAGVALLWTSFFVHPLGIIDSSVLAAVGEVFTFAGALIGIDYTYKYKFIKLHRDIEEENKGYDRDRTDNGQSGESDE